MSELLSLLFKDSVDLYYMYMYIHVQLLNCKLQHTACTGTHKEVGSEEPGNEAISFVSTGRSLKVHLKPGGAAEYM